MVLLCVSASLWFNPPPDSEACIKTAETQNRRDAEKNGLTVALGKRRRRAGCENTPKPRNESSGRWLVRRALRALGRAVAALVRSALSGCPLARSALAGSALASSTLTALSTLSALAGGRGTWSDACASLPGSALLAARAGSAARPTGTALAPAGAALALTLARRTGLFQRLHLLRGENLRELPLHLGFKVRDLLFLVFGKGQLLLGVARDEMDSTRGSSLAAARSSGTARPTRTAASRATRTARTAGTAILFRRRAVGRIGRERPANQCRTGQRQRQGNHRKTLHRNLLAAKGGG